MALSANRELVQEIGDLNDVPVAASQTIYHGAMVGNSAGYGRALTAGDKFLGHNAGSKIVAGASDAGLYSIKVHAGRYRMKAAVTGLEITDIGNPVYASDDATLTMLACGASSVNSFVGVVHRYISDGVGIVEFRPGENDEFGDNANRVLKSDNYTVLTTDSGKVIYVGTDAKVMTLLATEADLEVTFVNAGADGDVLLSVDPDGGDLIAGGCGIAAGTDGKKALNTKATAKRGDFIKLAANGGTGWKIVGIRGTWAMEG